MLLWQAGLVTVFGLDKKLKPSIFPMQATDHPILLKFFT